MNRSRPFIVAPAVIVAGLLCCAVLLAPCGSQNANGVEEPVFEPMALDLSVLGEVDKANLEQTVENLESFGERQSAEKQWQVAGYIFERMKSLGLDVEYQTYAGETVGNKSPQEFRNVVVTFTGTENPADVYVLGGHYDSEIGSGETIAPGANDNGSGVAVLMETARILKGVRLKDSLVIAFFSNEEQGHLGSEAFVNDYFTGKESDIKGAIIVDMVGDESATGDIDVATKPEHGWLADVIEKSITTYTGYPVKKIVDKQCA